MNNKTTELTGHRLLITGGAGFIGSNLVEHFLARGNEVVCLDNLSTGYLKNIEPFMQNQASTFIEGDIRDFQTCLDASIGCDYVFHQAALGSVPRSVADPITTNAVNISGFLNMLTAARDNNVKRFIYASSSSVYGDSKVLPREEDIIGSPLSPYAITKFVNEQYARVFSDLYGIETIGLRYFGVFGKRQDPEGAYAAVIPLWVKNLVNHEAPLINGDGSYSRDFTFIDNVVQANELAAVTPTVSIIDNLEYYRHQVPDTGYQIPGPDTTRNPVPGTCPERSRRARNPEPGTCPERSRRARYPISEVFNIAYGGNTTLTELFCALQKNLANHDPEIESLSAIHGPNRAGDIPHSMASIDKAKKVLGYDPKYDAAQGFEVACEWYFDNLK